MLERAVRTFLVIIVGLAAASEYARAQGTMADIHIRLEAGPGSPIGGAVVALMDGDRVVTEGLSNERGTVILRAGTGTYQVRVRRIGFRPYLSGSVTVPGPELLLTVETQKIVLNAMVVSAAAQCGAITRDAATLSTVWEEISKALRASQLTLGDLTGIGQMKTYRREFDGRGRITSVDTALVPITNRRPFGALDPLALTRLGYVRGDAVNGWEYFGPDEAVLLSDDFGATHCFKVVRDSRKRAGQIGVAFEPAPGRRVSDIKGVLWVDEKTAELRDVGFVYVNAGMISKFEPRGYTKFRRVRSGAWLVSDWQLRMPKVGVRAGFLNDVVAVGYVETGGLIESFDFTSTVGDSAAIKR